MITSKLPYASPSQVAPGFVSVLTVLSLGVGLLIIMMMMYQDTIQSQNDQKNNLLRNDYQQREEAFLSALTNIVPNRAMLCMMDQASGETNLDWNMIFTDALTQSNSHQAISDDDKTALGLTTITGIGNTADLNSGTTFTPASIIKSVFQTGALVSSGTNSVGSSSLDYPPLLSCDTTLNSDDQTYPVISHGKTDGFNELWGVIPAPKLQFTYQDNDVFIAKHNWWTFTVSFNDQNSDATGLTRVSKQYLVSLYEIPAQLAINSASFTNFGQHEGGSDWAGITTTGGIFAGGVKAKGSFTSSDGIASRQGIELADGSNPLASGDTANTTDYAARNKELYEDGAASEYNSSSDSGHVAFIPILPVLGLSHIGAGSTDDTLSSQYLADLKSWTGAGSDPATRPIDLLFYTRSIPVKFEKTGANTVSDSSTAWKYYSRGANQCKMVLIDDASGTSEFYIDIENDDTPSSMVSIVIDSKKVFEEASGGADLDVNLGVLIDYLASLGIDMGTVNSLCVNTTRNRVIFRDAKNLTLVNGAGTTYGFTNGFSIVSNKTLVLDEDVNNSSLPLSMYAPAARYGNNVDQIDIAKFKIEVTGNIGSLAERTKEDADNDDAVNIADLKVDYVKTNSADIETVVPTLSATLSSITNLNDLPPINMMNWMVVVREIRE